MKKTTNSCFIMQRKTANSQSNYFVAAVCHGIAALLNVKNERGRFFIDNKLTTGFSNTEEVLANRKNNVPFMLEKQIKKRGAYYSKSKIPFRPYVKIDDRLVTGQNTQSPKQVSQAVSKLLKEYNN